MNQKNLDTIKDFIGFCKKELEIQSLPSISFIRNRDFVETFRSFGEYNPNKMSIRVFITGRNLADICRSLAHELVHHRQQELGLIYDTAGETGTDIENDANSIAGIIMREYGKLNLSLYDLPSSETQSLHEIGDIANPYEFGEPEIDDDNNYFYHFDTPKHKYSVGISPMGDDSYEIVFNPGQEMGLDTNEGVALRVISTVMKITLDFIKKVEPEEIIIHPIATKGDKDLRRFRAYGAFLNRNLPSDYRLVTLGDSYRLLKKQ